MSGTARVHALLLIHAAAAPVSTLVSTHARGASTARCTGFLRCSRYNDDADAFRRCFLSCCLAQKIGARKAQQIWRCARSLSRKSTVREQDGSAEQCNRPGTRTSGARRKLLQHVWKCAAAEVSGRSL